MPRFLSCPSRAPWRVCWFFVLAVLGGAGCGEVTCPKGLSDVGGVCATVDSLRETEPDPKPDTGTMRASPNELCDGVDNDGDQLVDETWPELGEPCGESEGECAAGEWVCARDARGVVCEGALGPVAEVCDGRDNDCDGTVDNGPAEVCDGEDNDCDGLIDEGVWSVKQQSFDDHAAVSAIKGGFAVTRLVAGQVRVETYDTEGVRTGHHDDVDSPTPYSAFLESDAFGGKVVVALGKYRFFVLEAYVEEDLVPIIEGTHPLHEDWNQGIDLGTYEPPFHPRVIAEPGRFLGHRDILTFGLSPFGDRNLRGLAEPPVEVSGIPYYSYFDVSGPLVVWEERDNVRAGLLFDGGNFTIEIDIARGTHPAVAITPAGPAVALLRDGAVSLSELKGTTLQCRKEGLCDAIVDAGPIYPGLTTTVGVAYHGPSDTWVVAVDERLMLVGRKGGEAVVKQVEPSPVGNEPPSRIGVVVSADTAAIVQAADSGDSVLTFMGCF